MPQSDYKSPKIYDITVPDLISLIAEQNPRKDFVQIIKERPNGQADIERITLATFIKHVHNAATALRAQWAQTVQDGSLKAQAAARPRCPGEPLVVVGMLGTNGYEFYVNMWACTFNRWTVLLISPKNSPDAIEHLLRTSKANMFLVDRMGQQLTPNLHGSIENMATLQFADLDPSANDCLWTPFTPEETKEELDLPAFYMHTSGSTGHPKIITWTHRFFLSGYRMRQRDGPEDIGKHMYCIPPQIHAVGMFANGLFTLAHGNIVVYLVNLVPRPPSAASVLFCLPYIKNAILALPPSIIEEIHELGPDAIKALADSPSKVVFAGAPLKQKVGDELVAAGVKILSAYGSTELNPATKIILQKRAEDWPYVQFREGYDWQLLPVDDHSELRELIAVPAEDTPAAINHENPRGFATNDIWVPHPTVPNLWKHHSRKGDVTVLSNGEKTDNKQIENLLRTNKLIRLVQVFGAGRPLNGVILQPSNPSIPPEEFLSLIQPTIEHANSVLPKHSRLVPELIIVAPENKPFATTDKGTVRTKETVENFAEEIESGYAALEKGNKRAFEGDAKNPQDVKAFVREAVQRVLETDIGDAEDLFDHGLDSLLAIQLRAALLPVLTSSPTASQSVPRNITYTYPSIDALTTYLLSRTSAQNAQLESASDRIRRSFAKFASGFVPHKSGGKEAQGVAVALTGSTGSVGSLILALLLQRDDVSKVYLLNRKGAAPQQERQAAGFQERAIDTRILEDKANIITYLDVDLSRSDLGLATKDYEELRDNVTHIIHSAWHLNFNLILESYERVHIAGVRHLIDLALASPHPQSPRLTFLSSIAASAGYRHPSPQGEQAPLIPEEPIDDPTIALDQGYGQGKYVSERMLVAAEQAGLRTTIIRVGQLSGTSTNGAWSTSEHVPITFRSSIELGMIPDDFPAVRWIPSDVAASAIVKQTFGSSAALEYFHVDNSVPTPWENIAKAVAECSPRPLALVSHKTWLEHIARQDVDAEKVPAVRLLEFFQGIAQQRDAAVLGWQRSVQVAPELACGVVSPELIKKYVSYQLEKSRV